VLATLHTNDAPSAISRLQDIGVEPFLISSSVLAVMAQRLLRKLATDGSGGYAGRIAIFEIMRLNDDIRALCQRTADAGTIRAEAVKHGFKPMEADGMEKVRAGLTTEVELHRVLA